MSIMFRVTMFMHHLGDASPLPIAGGKPAGPACQS